MATGHIRKRTTKNGTVKYQIIVETERNPLTGKRERFYKTINGNKKQADAELRKMISELEAGCPVTTSGTKLSAWMDEWLNLYVINVEATTKAGYEEKIRNYIKPNLGHIPVNALKTATIQQWVNELSTGKGLSPKTIKNAYQNLNAALEKAVALQMIPTNPCKNVVLPKARKTTTNVYNKAEIDQMLHAAQGTDFYLALLLMVTVGLRRGELVGLKWDHIDLNKRTITICDTIVTVNGKAVKKPPKSEAGKRMITIGPELTGILKRARLDYFNDMSMKPGFNASGYVVHKQNGDPYNPDSITQKWERFREKQGLKNIRLHDLRHSCATMMIASGVDPKTVQHRLGHADISITMNTYAHCTPEMDKVAAQKIDDVIFSIA